MPTVTVIMSVYNGELYLAKSIKSILQQTFKDFQFFIADDGSTDNSRKIIHQYQKMDNRIVLFEGTNSGLTTRLNYLASIASTPFIARMDADDISEPTRLEEQVNYMKKNVKCGVVGTGFIQIDKDDKVCRGVIRRDDNENLKKELLTGYTNVFTHGSVMMRSEILNKFSPIYRFKYSQDFDLWLRLKYICEFGMVEKILYRYRVHDNAIQSCPLRAKKRLFQRKRLIEIDFNNKIFDNEYCENEINSIWSKELKIECNEKFTNNICNETSFRSLLVNGDTYNARKSLMRLTIPNTRADFKAFSLKLLLYLPPLMAMFVIDTAVEFCNLGKSTKSLTFKSLKSYSESI